jgi:chromate transporter
VSAIPTIVPRSDALAAPPHPSFAEAFRYWLRLGFISFGGPAGQISIMHQDLVERMRWISEHRFLHALNYCMVLPGPEAQQLAIYIGWLLHGTRGGIAAGVLFVLPSVFILIALSWIYLEYGDLTLVSGVLYGIKPAVTAIVLYAAYRIGSRALKNAWLWAVAAFAFVAIFALNVPFPYIVIGAGLIGLVGGRFAPDKFRMGAGHGESHKTFGPALIDDHTPLPAHARYRASKLVLYFVTGVGLWIAATALLIALFGWEGTLTRMGWFFTKAALLTFGGAYAVLPYVYQGGVDQYQWLTATQMIDGLALGETTPGPLIMIVAFVGFVGAWTKEVFGPEALALAGSAGALTATYFTFLPCFLFILIGAPAIEATRHDVRLTAPLTGITAAVVGVVLNLALFFAYHVLWPMGFGDDLVDAIARFEWFSALIGIAAFIALIRYRIGVIPVIGASGLAGLLYTLAQVYLA